MKKIQISIVFLFLGMTVFSQEFSWDNRFISSNSPNDIVYCQTIYNGNIIIGGQFTNVAGTSSNYVAMWDGTAWQVLGSGFNGKVLALTVWENKIVAGGEFTQAGATPLNYLAYWNGGVWNDLASGTNGPVYALNVWDLKLYVGGNFSTVGGTLSANNIAFFETPSWNAMDSGTNDIVRAIDFYNSTVVIGGDFTIASGDTVNYLAIFDIFNTWNSIGTGADAPVYTLKSINGNSFYIGGVFSTFDGNTSNYLILRKDTSWITFNTDFNDTVFAITGDSGKIYVGGSFSQVSGMPANNIVSWDGVAYDTLSSGLNGNVYSLKKYLTDIFVGGNFSIAGTNESNYFAIWGIKPWLQNESANQTLCIGDTLNIYCNYYSTSTITYQWYLDGNIISGAVDSNYIVSSSTLADTGNYYCIATNIYGIDTSGIITVTINTPPSVTADPIDATICENDSVAFIVGAIGSSPLLYQWQFNGSNILGANSNPFTIYLSDTSDVGQYRCQISNMCGVTMSEMANLYVNLLPSVNFTGLDSNYCNNSNADTLVGIPAGGTFSGNGISGFVFNPNSLSGTQPITYTFTDSNSCMNQITLYTDVNVVQPLDFSGLDSSYCYSHGTDTLTPSISGGTFTGLGINNDSLYDPLSVLGLDTVSYSLTDTNGCVANSIHITYVFQYPPITFLGVDSIYCLGNSPDSIWATPYGGSFTGLTSGYFQYDTVGNYLITYSVSQDGCSGSDSIQITVNASPSATMTAIDSAICNNHSPVILSGIPAGGTFLGSGVVDSVFYPAQADTGLVQLIYQYIDSVGCAAQDTQSTYILPTQVVTFYPLDTAYCINHDTVTLYGYPSGGTFSGDGITDSIFHPLIAGNGIHDVIYSWLNSNGCLSADTQSTTIYDVPNISFDDTVSMCLYDSIQLLIVNNDTTISLNYIWSTLDTTASILVSPTHDFTYYVTVTSGICQLTETVFVPVNNLPIVNLNNSYNICRNDTISAGYDYPAYLWLPDNSIDSFLIVQNSGVYYLVVTDSNGCQNSDTTTVTLKPTPEVELLDEISIQQGNSVIIGTGNGYDSYLWSTGDTTFYLIYNPTLAVIPGDYYIWLTATNNNGCWDSDTVWIHVTEGVGFEDIANLFNIQVFPNPSSGHFTVSLKRLNQKTISLTLFDVTGRKLFSDVRESVDNYYKEFHLETTSSSILILQIKVDNEQFLKKIIIQK